MWISSDGLWVGWPCNDRAFVRYCLWWNLRFGVFGAAGLVETLQVDLDLGGRGEGQRFPLCGQPARPIEDGDAEEGSACVVVRHGTGEGCVRFVRFPV